MMRVAYGILFGCLFLMGTAQGQLRSGKNLVRIQAVLSVNHVHPGSTFQIAVIADLEKGWHINAHQPSLEYLIPTEVDLVPIENVTFGEVQYPNPISLKFDFADQSLDVYQQRVIFRLPVSVAANELPGKKIIRGTLRYQACNDQVCLPPASVGFDFPLQIDGLDKASRPIHADIFGAVGAGPPQPPATESGLAGSESEVARLVEQQGLFLALVTIFLLGLALNLTPCVYPMIPITIGYFSHQSEGKTSRIFVLALMYLVGIAVTYSVLGVVAALTGQMFGALLQNSWVLIGIAAVMLLLALSLFGVYQIRPPSFIMQRISAQSGGGMFGALTMGLVVGIVAAPCVGPVTIGLLTYVGATGNPWLGFLMFFTLSVGLGAPYVVLGTFSGGLKKLPKSGVWMIWVERLFGFALVGMALYFVAPLLPDDVVPWMVLALAATSGVYLGWVEKSSTGGRAFYWLKKVTAVVILAIGVYAVTPRTAGATMSWQHYDEAILDQAKADGQPVILDFYADWCIPCGELDRSTFTDADVVEATKMFARVKVDMTRYDSPIAERLRQQFGVSGVPTIIFLSPQGQEVTQARVVGYMGAKDFLQRVKWAHSSQ